MLGGRYYKQIINSLSGIGLITINEKYSLKRFSKSFAITDKSIKLGIEKVEIKTKRFNSTLNNSIKSEFDSISNDDLIMKVLVNTARLYLVKDFGNYMAKILPTVKVNKPIDHIELLDIWLDQVNTFKVDRYSSYFDSFLELNNHSDPYEVFKLPVFSSLKLLIQVEYTILGQQFQSTLGSALQLKVVTRFMKLICLQHNHQYYSLSG